MSLIYNRIPTVLINYYTDTRWRVWFIEGLVNDIGNDKHHSKHYQTHYKGTNPSEPSFVFVEFLSSTQGKRLAASGGFHDFVNFVKVLW